MQQCRHSISFYVAAEILSWDTMEVNNFFLIKYMHTENGKVQHVYSTSHQSQQLRDNQHLEISHILHA